MEEKYRIIVDNVSKKFNIGFKKNQGALARLLSSISGKETKKELQVVRNISLSAKAGEIIGIIGKNGSGKSTLLRIIAGIYRPDEGKIVTEGKMIYLTGFGQGLNNRLTMRENIYLMASVMGLSQKDIKKRFNEIVDFSGLKDFVDTKVYQFSSGMVARLNISVTLHCVAHTNPDILLLDEVFAGGTDLEFQEKGLKKMEELIKSGATIIFVSHDLDTVKKYCDRVIWMEKGEIAKEDLSKETINAYKESVNS